MKHFYFILLARVQLSQSTYVSYADESLIDAISSNDWDSALRLVNSGADPNAAVTLNGMSCLMMALKQNADPIFVNLLIERGARLDGIDRDGNTVYHYAAQSSLAVLHVILKLYPVPLFSHNADRETPFMITERIGYLEASKMLAPHEMRRACLNGDLTTVEFMIIHYSIDINAILPGGRTCYDLAYRSQHEALLEFLVKSGARLDLGDLDDTPPRLPFEGPPKPVKTARASELPLNKINHDRTIRRKTCSTTLVLHSDPINWNPKPRVTILLSGNHVGFSFFFDTGSNDSIIAEDEKTPEERIVTSYGLSSYAPIDGIDHSSEPVSRPAKCGEGYLNWGGCYQGKPRTICFGSDQYNCSVVLNGKIEEIAYLYSGEQLFEFDINIALAKNPKIGIGLLGAGYNSDFTKAAGIFTYLGPSVRYTGPKETTGTLIIGERNESILKSHCLQGQELRFFPRLTQLAGFKELPWWAVPGSVTMNNERGTAIASADMNWIIDTGANCLAVSSEMKATIKEAMLRNGAELFFERLGRSSVFTRCPAPASLPSFTVYLGTGSGAVPVVLNAEDYIAYDEGKKGYCRLLVTDSMAENSMRLIGIPLLSKLLTVFDAENDRLGFCISRL